MATPASATPGAPGRRAPAGSELHASPRAPKGERRPLIWTLIALAAAAGLTLVQLWVPLVLAAWATLVVHPLHAWFARLVRGRSRAAAVVTVALVLAVLTPLVFVVLTLTASITDFVDKLQHTADGREAIAALLAPPAASTEAASATPPTLPENAGPQQLMGLFQRHGSAAIGAVRTLFGAATAVAIGAFVFVFAFYTFLVDGPRGYGWLVDHVPLERAHVARLSAAFEETGRGILISFGLTSLVQGGLATIGYLIIGVPQPLMLGLFTSLGSFIPIVGTALVWVPVTLGMIASHRPGAALAVTVLGLAVSSLDNFLRPALSRYGRLELPTFVIFAAMLGGIAAFGAGGLFLGPLLVRMGIEALRIGRELRG